jgi:hypothetical protein
MENEKTANWEKISVFIALFLAFLAIISYTIDTKVDVAKLQEKVEHLERRNGQQN